MLTSLLVYCGSSGGKRPEYARAAADLGRLLAERNVALVYGGGSAGLMGVLANATLDAGGRVIGVIPKFMQEVEWSHERLTELHVVDDMHGRKHKMLELADAVAALPGGCGTLEELLEAITWKRLGLYAGPIALVNIAGYFDPCLAMLDRCIAERFMNPHHRDIWLTVDEPASLLDRLEAAPPPPDDALNTAAVRPES